MSNNAPRTPLADMVVLYGSLLQCFFNSNIEPTDDLKRCGLSGRSCRDPDGNENFLAPIARLAFGQRTAGVADLWVILHTRIGRRFVCSLAVLLFGSSIYFIWELPVDTTAETHTIHAETSGMIGIGASVIMGCLAFASPLYLSLWQSLTDSLSQVHTDICEAALDGRRPEGARKLYCSLKIEALRVYEHLTQSVRELRLLFTLALLGVFATLLALGLMFFLDLSNIRGRYLATEILIVASISTALLYFVLIAAVQGMRPIPQKITLQHALGLIATFESQFGDCAIATALVARTEELLSAETGGADVNYDMPCLRCKALIPHDKTQCQSCGWSYNAENATPATQELVEE